MAQLRIIYRTEKKKILKLLEYYGITDLNFLLTESGKEKIRGYTGSLSNEELIELNQQIGIELIGMYLFNVFKDEVRLSFDAISALKYQITKNILEVSEEHESEFLKGRDIALTKEEQLELEKSSEQRGFKIIKSKSTQEFLGTGKFIGDRIVNYMPKERRLR